MSWRNFFFIPLEERRPNRLYYLDGLRACSLLLMMFTHGLKNWINPAYETPFTLFLKDWLTRLPAPVFLSLVGASYLLTRNARLRKGWDRTRIFGYYARRSLFILFFAYLYRAVDYFFGVAWADIRLWEVDVLNIIAVSLFLLALFDFLFHRFSWAVWGYLVMTWLIIILTPLAPLWHFPAWIPWFITDYINGVAPDAYFNIFPYTHYLFFGAFLAHYLGQGAMAHPWQSAKKLVAFLAAVIVGGLLLHNFIPGNDLVSGLCLKAAFFAGTHLLLLASIWAAYIFYTRVGFGPLLLIGSHTLAAYWIHAKIIFIHYQPYLGVSTWGTSFWLLAKVYLMTFALVFGYINAKRWWKKRKNKLVQA